MFACFFFGFSLYCVMFSFALIDCWDYFGFCLMTTNRNALLIAILEDNILLQWRWIYENHVCDLQIKKWKWKGFKSYLCISENIAWKNYGLYGIWSSKQRCFHVQYFACYTSYFKCPLGKCCNSRQPRNWRIYHHGWHSKGVPSRGFRIYLRHQQWKRRWNTAR